MTTRTASHWRLLAGLLRPDLRRLGALGIALTGAASLPLVGPQLLRAFIDRAADDVAIGVLLGIAGTYVLLGVVGQCTQVATTYAANRIAWAATNALRERAAAHVLALDLAFHRDTTPGALLERVDGDATAIARFFTDVVVKVVVGGLMLAGVVVLVTVEDWRAGLALATFAVLTGVVIMRLREHAVPATAADRAAQAAVVGTIEERLAGADDLRALGASGHAVAKLEEASAAALATGRRAERRNVAIWAVLSGLFALGALGMLLGAAWLHAQGLITLGTVFLLFTYTQVLRMPVEQLTEQLQEVQRAAAGAARIADLLEQTPALPAGGAATLPAGALPLRCAAVSYAYPDDNQAVLRGIDLDVPAGARVGLVGRSGSGKTTLGRLLLRLVDPTAGTVLVAGTDLRDLAAASLRARIATVTQDVQLFRTSVRDNLTLFGAHPAVDARLTAVLAEVGLDGWLAGLPEGLATTLGPGGAGLSAGEAQLLGFARVFLRDPGLILLDEASSRVDPATQARVEAATDRLLAGRTAVLIAHRLSSVLRCDHVVLLEHGEIVEQGPPRTLAADARSRFAALLALDHDREGVL